MKKVLVLMLVLATASVANAALSGLLISVNGVVDPPDSQVFAQPSDYLVIDIHGDGSAPPNVYMLGMLVRGPATLSIGQATIPYPGGFSYIQTTDNTDIADYMGVKNPYVEIQLSATTAPIPPLNGLLVDNIILHCEGLGDVTLILFNGDGVIYDSQVIHQIPEPITMVLLGLGGLFLRRRIA